MTLTLLFDLDDTLLNTNTEAFIPAYFQALASELAPFVQPEMMLKALNAGTQRMLENVDFSQSLEETFNAVFYPQIQARREEIAESIENFYDRVFPTLGSVTSPKPEAEAVVKWAMKQGFRVAIATDPLFPRKATHHRLRWAGFEPEQFELISSFEHFHFSKSHPAYYAEMLGRLGWDDAPVLMVGNDLERDIRPANEMGLATYHVCNDAVPADGMEGMWQGSLSGLRAWLEAIDPSQLKPSFRTREAVLGILCATPAVFNGFSRELDRAAWTHKPGSGEWCVKEILSHLRDTEREVNQMQIRLFEEAGEPFIPRPDTSIWASERDYMDEDCATALMEFNQARRQTLDMLSKKMDWERKARHAIFGGTNFLEVVGFMAEHDRLHIHQAWKTLKNL